jgi:hypothetical protein
MAFDIIEAIILREITVINIFSQLTFSAILRKSREKLSTLPHSNESSTIAFHTVYTNYQFSTVHDDDDDDDDDGGSGLKQIS